MILDTLTKANSLRSIYLKPVSDFIIKTQETKSSPLPQNKKKIMIKILFNEIYILINKLMIVKYGTFAEYIILPAFNMVPLPDNVDMVHGSLMEPLAVGYHAAQNGNFQPGETATVIGTGPIGLMTILSLKAVGAGKIICSDMSEARLKLAGELGVDVLVDIRKQDLVEVVKAETDGLGSDRTIICTDAPSSFYQAINATRNCGDVILVGMIQSKLEFSPMDIFGRDINIISNYTFTDEIFEAVDMVSQGKIDLEPMITSIYSLDHGKAAFDALAVPDNSEIKVVVDIWGNQKGTAKWKE